MTTFRTDRNNNPTAFTTDIAKEAGLVLGVDFLAGDTFNVSQPNGTWTVLYTAKLLKDPIATTIKVIDKLTFYTKYPYSHRWTYIAIPPVIWTVFSEEEKKTVIKAMYQCEGGTELLPLFS